MVLANMMKSWTTSDVRALNVALIEQDDNEEEELTFTVATPELNTEQKKNELLGEMVGVLSMMPERVMVLEHTMDTGVSSPSRPYRISPAWKESLKEEH